MTAAIPVGHLIRVLRCVREQLGVPFGHDFNMKETLGSLGADAVGLRMIAASLKLSADRITEHTTLAELAKIPPGPDDE